MSTITLYANKVNRMPGLLSDAKRAVKSYKSDLTSLKNKVMSIDRSVCNVDNIISTLQSSTQTQEQKITSLDNFKKQSDEFIADTVRADNNVADVVEKRKDDFYDKFSYLKPECEKDWKEKTKDWFDSVGAWCKEHWKEILITVAIVIGAIVAIVTIVASGGLALVPLLTALGLSASLATGISIAVAGIALVSVIGSSVLNIIDTWKKIENPILKTLKIVLNWTSIISGGIYSVGLIYNGINGISNAYLKELDGNRLVNVTRWGRPGLQSGDWVMRGKNTWFNYIFSFKWDPNPTNQVAAKITGETFQVLRRTLYRPTGWGMDGFLKRLFFQWRYFP